MRDIAAELHTLERDLRQLGIRLFKSRADIRSDGGDGQYAATGSDELTVLERCAGVKDDNVVSLLSLRRKPSNQFAAGVFPRIAAARSNDADASSRTHPNGELVGRAVDRSIEEV